MQRSEKITLKTPQESLEGILNYTSREYMAGCQGFVRPATISFGDGGKKRVRVKRFFEESVDDRGNPFTQDPDEEVQRSYNSLIDLRLKGFKVVPYFALGKTKGGNVLVLEDLTQEGKLEVYDEKDFHKYREVAQIVSGCLNWNQVLLEALRTNLLQTLHHLSLGLGVSRMITRDPKTNMADAYITDVGEVFQIGWEGDLSKILKYKDFQFTGPLEIFSALIKDQGLAQDLFQKLHEQDPSRAEFMELVHRAYVSESFWSQWAGGDVYGFAVENFRKKRFNKESLWVKVLLDKFLFDYEDIKGVSLFNWDKDSKAEFLSARTSRNEEGLMRGVEYAHLACIDWDLFYLDKLRKAGKLLPKEPFPNRVSKLRFMEEASERVEHPLLTVGCDSGHERGHRAMTITVDWRTGYSYANHIPFPLFIFPNQIQAVYNCELIRREPFLLKRLIPDFDKNKIRVEISKRQDVVCYFHDDVLFHVVYAGTRWEGARFPSKKELRRDPKISFTQNPNAQWYSNLMSRNTVGRL